MPVYHEIPFLFFVFFKCTSQVETNKTTFDETSEMLPAANWAR